MPKFSIYVPDDLWTAVLAASPDVKPSPLVQAALKRLVDDRSLSARAQLPEAVIVQRDRVVRRAAAQAAGRYVDGYQIGLSFIEELPWAAIEDFDRIGLDIDEWDPFLSTYGKNFSDEWRDHSADVLESFIAQDEKPTGMLRDGFLDAFRDVLAAAKSLSGEEDVNGPSGALTELASASPTSTEQSES